MYIKVSQFSLNQITIFIKIKKILKGKNGGQVLSGAESFLGGIFFWLERWNLYLNYGYFIKSKQTSTHHDILMKMNEIHRSLGNQRCQTNNV